MRRPTPGELALLALGLAPWSWYVVRDVDARLDIVAMVWPIVGVGAIALLVLAALVVRDRRVGLVALSWALATLAIVVGPWRPLDTGTPADGVRIAAVNIFGGNTYAPGVASEVDAQDPDIVVVSETTDEAMAAYGEEYDNSARSPGVVKNPKGDVAVFSDLPFEAEPLPASLEGQRGMRLEIEGPAGPFVLYALHLSKPGPNPSAVVAEVGFRSHRRLVDALVDAIEDEALPVVVAGDLNLVDRTSGYRALSAVLDDGLRSGWVGPTSLKRTTRLLLARIDHVFIPEDWCSEDGKTFTMRGSDHRGVAATVGPCA